MKAIDEVGKMLMNIYWSLGVAGLILVVLGVLIFIIPELLAILVAIGLVVFGMVLWMLAYKVRQLWEKLPNFMK
jgi:Flp pilus assembly protein TadB